ncbi:MAG: 50S ribosomal protein L9 [Verrucomicrobia bacterium]|nr:50S ribosomal protein L9 [Verrucomicrobiota bacterium]
MVKEVILMADVDGLGDQGDVVKVADGYARNFLLPKNLAAPVTEATRRKLEVKRKQQEEALVAGLSAAQKLAAAISAASCTITVKTGEEGKLFGSVSSADIAENLKQQGLTVDKLKIDLPEPLRELGVFNVGVKLHPEVAAEIKVWVVEE